MKRNIKLKDWMICDDIRKEDNGKLIFIGVYFDNILVPNIPFLLPQLIFFSKWNTKDIIPKKFEFKIIQPNKKIIGPIEGEIPHPETDTRKETLIIRVGIIPFNIEECGEYKIQVKIDDIPYDVGSFNVILKPSSP